MFNASCPAAQFSPALLDLAISRALFNTADTALDARVVGWYRSASRGLVHSNVPLNSSWFKLFFYYAENDAMLESERWITGCSEMRSYPGDLPLLSGRKCRLDM